MECEFYLFCYVSDKMCNLEFQEQERLTVQIAFDINVEVCHRLNFTFDRQFK